MVLFKKFHIFRNLFFLHVKRLNHAACGLTFSIEVEPSVGTVSFPQSLRSPQEPPPPPQDGLFIGSGSSGSGTPDTFTSIFPISDKNFYILTFFFIGIIIITCSPMNKSIVWRDNFGKIIYGRSGVQMLRRFAFDYSAYGGPRSFVPRARR